MHITEDVSKPGCTNEFYDEYAHETNVPNESGAAILNALKNKTNFTLCPSLTATRGEVHLRGYKGHSRQQDGHAPDKLVDGSRVVDTGAE